MERKASKPVGNWASGHASLWLPIEALLAEQLQVECLMPAAKRLELDELALTVEL